MNEETENHEGPPSAGKPRSHKARPPEGALPIHAPAKAGIPPCPDEDPLAGDKTPAVIAWWFKHHPEQAAAKYKGRKFQLPTGDE